MVKFTGKEFKTIMDTVFIDPDFFEIEVIKCEYENEYINLMNDNEEMIPDIIEEVEFSNEQHNQLYSKIEDLRFELEHERWIISKEPTIEEEQGLWNNY